MHRSRFFALAAMDIEQLIIKGLINQTPRQLIALARNEPLTALLIEQNELLRDKLVGQCRREFEEIITQINPYRSGTLGQRS